MKISSPIRHFSHWATIPLALALLSLTLSHPVAAQEKQDQVLLHTLTVSGQGVVMIPTTLTQVELGVEAQGKTAQEVQQEVARRSTNVVTLLKSRNVEKLETTGISLNPLYSYNNNVQRLTGYSATNTVRFRLDTKEAGNLIDEAVKAGASRINGISFTASESAIKAAQQQALKEATQDAQQQADTVLAVLNLKRQEVVSIQINAATPPPPPRPIYNLQAAAVAKEASTPVVGSEQQVEASVTLQIRY